MTQATEKPTAQLGSERSHDVLLGARVGTSPQASGLQRCDAKQPQRQGHNSITNNLTGVLGVLLRRQQLPGTGHLDLEEPARAERLGVDHGRVVDRGLVDLDDRAGDR